MKNSIFTLLIVVLFASCKEKQPSVIFKKYDETAELKAQQDHPRKRMQFKLLQSKVLDMNAVFAPFEDDLSYFSAEDYETLKPLIIEQDIPTLQEHVYAGRLSYEKLTLFYLYRIRKFESDSTKSLNAIIALNPNVLKEARQKDNELKKQVSLTPYQISGMPILLKDNINTKGMPTTAGALALQNNTTTEDAFIVQRLKEEGALILGKVNLSEWAYFFCSGCPLGYSAIGGQTLNPYGRKEFETGGSSAGSGVTVAANYAVAAIGTETAGSITSPSSQNSLVGLKPTIGLLSRTGIVPISSTLDTPGPMTKNVVDNYILLTAMMGYDAKDAASYSSDTDYLGDIDGTLKGKRFGVLDSYLQDSIFNATIEKLKVAGAEIVVVNPKNASFNGFTTLLNIDMKHDLPNYLKDYADPSVMVTSVQDVVDFNLQDSLLRAPYGQQLFDGIVVDTTSLVTLEKVKTQLREEARTYFSSLHNDELDAFLSINNYHSGSAAVALQPTITLPMGYKTTGEPVNLTLVGLPKQEGKLIMLAAAIEELGAMRKIPEHYK